MRPIVPREGENDVTERNPPMPGARRHPKRTTQATQTITDEQIDAAIEEIERRADRFKIEMQPGDFEIEDVGPVSSLFLVRDTLTSRVRETTHDFADANAVVSWLNSGRVYDGGEPELLPAA